MKVLQIIENKILANQTGDMQRTNRLDPNNSTHTKLNNNSFKRSETK